MSMRNLLTAVLAAGLAATVPAWAGKITNFPAPTYSNLCVHADTGDILGETVVLLPGDQSVVYVAAEGVLAAPRLLQVKRSDGGDVAYSPAGDLFRFTRGENGLELVYLKGQVARTGQRSTILQRVSEAAAPPSCGD